MSAGLVLVVEVVELNQARIPSRSRRKIDPTHIQLGQLAGDEAFPAALLLDRPHRRLGSQRNLVAAAFMARPEKAPL